MDQPGCLQFFEDLSYYRAHFMEAGLWAPSVHRVCDRHGFDCQNVSPGLAGTFPTFIVDTMARGSAYSPGFIVVKFFGAAFNGLEACRVERSLGSWLERHPLPIPSPAILADGQLEAGWRYLIFEYIPGTSIGQVREQIPMDEWAQLAIRMGELMRVLHTSRITDLPDYPGLVQLTWDGFGMFLQQQRRHCLASHRAWNDLPSHLLGQLESFVQPVEQLVDLTSLAHLIHADLTADHMLGRMTGGSWQTLAIIDWGDAMTGNILYELLALQFDFFRGDTQLLKLCLESYDLPVFFRQGFPRKAFSMALLSQFPLPDWITEPHQHFQTLDELAERLFGF